MNKFVGEFDYAGLINEGEYLILCPYQTNQDIKTKFEKISEAIETISFANLGDYSLKINYSFDSPNVQDIDPFIFLSKLSETVNRDQNSFNQSKSD
ncbi:MAG: hypothetical protein HRT37_03145 [Alteromonadaceae bacterium]|nr:hypothetical protein [Alteromonadaceae bacterium]